MWAILSFQSFNQPNLPLWTLCVSFLSIPGGSSGSLPSSWPHDLHQTWNIHQNIWPMSDQWIYLNRFLLKTNCKWFFVMMWSVFQGPQTKASWISPVSVHWSRNAVKSSKTVSFGDALSWSCCWSCWNGSIDLTPKEETNIETRYNIGYLGPYIQCMISCDIWLIIYVNMVLVELDLTFDIPLPILPTCIHMLYWTAMDHTHQTIEIKNSWRPAPAPTPAAAAAAVLFLQKKNLYKERLVPWPVVVFVAGSEHHMWNNTNQLIQVQVHK